MSAQQKLFAWAVIGDNYEYAMLPEEHARAVAEEEGGKVVPLYRQPKPALTDDEREEVRRAREGLLSGISGYDNCFANEKRRRADVLAGIIQRFG